MSIDRSFAVSRCLRGCARRQFLSYFKKSRTVSTTILKNQDRTRGYLTQNPKIALFSMGLYKFLITSKSQKQQVVQALIFKIRHRTGLMLQDFVSLHN